MTKAINNHELLNRLIAVIEDLYKQSEGFTDCPENSQLWYNHGYADGMVKALLALGYRDRIAELRRHTKKVAVSARCQAGLPWGKAYGHGLDSGYKETREVLRSASS